MIPPKDPFPFSIQPQSRASDQWAEQLRFAYQVATGAVDRTSDWPDGVIKNQLSLPDKTGSVFRIQAQEALRSAMPDWTEQITRQAQKRHQLWNVELDRLAILQRSLFPQQGNSQPLRRKLHELKRWLQQQRTPVPETLGKLCSFQSSLLLKSLAQSWKGWNSDSLECFLQQHQQAQPPDDGTDILVSLLQSSRFPTARLGEQVLEASPAHKPEVLRSLLNTRNLPGEVAKKVIDAYADQGHMTGRALDAMLAYNPAVYRHTEVLQNLLQKIGPQALLALSETHKQEIWPRAVETVVEQYPDAVLEKLNEEPDGLLFHRLQRQHLPQLLQAQTGQGRTRATRLVARWEQANQSIWQRIKERLTQPSSGRSR